VAVGIRENETLTCYTKRINLEHFCKYRKSPDRSPRLLSVQFALTPGLYPGPDVYPEPGFYRNMSKALILGYRIVHNVLAYSRPLSRRMVPPPPAGIIRRRRRRKTARRRASRNYRPPPPPKFLRRAVKGIKIHAL